MWYLIIIIALLAIVAYMWYSNSKKPKACGCGTESRVNDELTKPGEVKVDTDIDVPEFNRSPIVPSSVTF